jgi:signal peptidase I
MRISLHQLIPIVEELLRAGQRIRLEVAGSSMYPFIKDGDVVEIEKPGPRLQKGDVLLVRVCGNSYVIHRVVKVDGEYFFLRGDFQQGLQGPFRRGDIVGRVVAIYRGGRRYTLERGFLRIMSLLWIRITPSRRVLTILVNLIKVIDGALAFILRGRE